MAQWYEGYDTFSRQRPKFHSTHQKSSAQSQGTEQIKSSTCTKVDYTWTEYQVMPIHSHTRLVGEHTKPE